MPITKNMVTFFYVFSEKNYTINVKTGDVSKAGTDANVFLIIYGDLGDSGEHKLHKSETHRDKFEKGQVSTSYVMQKFFLVYVQTGTQSVSNCLYAKLNGRFLTAHELL